MSKKILASIAAILATTVVFAACGEETIVDREGNTVEYMTDENKEMVQDNEGNIVVPKTDANGKKVKDKEGNLVTESVTFPEVLEVGDYVHNRYVKTKIPDGWQQIGKLTTIIIDNEEYDAQYTIQIEEKKSVEDVESYWMKQFKTEETSDLVKDHSIKKSEVEIGGKKMLRITRDYTLKEKSVDGKTGQSLIVYLVDAGEDTLQYTGVISPENKGKVDFDKLISEIIYK